MDKTRIIVSHQIQKIVSRSFGCEFGAARHCICVVVLVLVVVDQSIRYGAKLYRFIGLSGQST